MSVWSTDSLEQHLGRKVVPEGSNHFQRVLDDILCCEYTSEDNKKETYFVQEEYNKSEYYERYKILDRLEENNTLQRGQLQVLTNNNIEKNNNNVFSSTSCSVDKCNQQGSTNKNTKPENNQTSIGIATFTSKTSQNIEGDKGNNEHFLQLLEIDELKIKMGTSCSSNFYDHREWHNVKGDISIEAVKPKKRGRFLKKRAPNDRANEQESLYSPCVEASTEKSQVPLDECRCQHESNRLDMAQPTRPQTFQANGPPKICDKRTSLSPEDIFETSCTQLTNNRLSPNVDSCGHVQLSRIVGSGRARATTECDVSPHRLLTRRCNSQNGRPCGLDAKSSTVNHCEERPRSQSWSNGKLGDRAKFKANNLTIRQSLSNSLKGLKTSASLILSDKAPKSVSASTATVSTNPKTEARDTECMLHIKPEEVPKISISIAQAKIHEEDDTELAPIARRRAASESLTMRPRRLLPRTPDSSDQIQEHAHVRWADEKKGSSLSTSVFLTNIRPRSRSYGAMDCVPHRPILKKVAGL